jgi:hypothetical protein
MGRVRVPLHLLARWAVLLSAAVAGAVALSYCAHVSLQSQLPDGKWQGRLTV